MLNCCWRPCPALLSSLQEEVHTRFYYSWEVWSVFRSVSEACTPWIGVVALAGFRNLWEEDNLLVESEGWDGGEHDHCVWALLGVDEVREVGGGNDADQALSERVPQCVAGHRYVLELKDLRSCRDLCVNGIALELVWFPGGFLISLIEPRISIPTSLSLERWMLEFLQR